LSIVNTTELIAHSTVMNPPKTSYKLYWHSKMFGKSVVGGSCAF